jgi:pyruvate dehydrogenase E1 component alpha subunit
MYSTEHRFYGGNGIVGAQVPIGTGLAFAHKYKNDGGVCVAYFGDGAANQGQIYEAFNMAELWRLPVLYVIENNQYAMGTSVERASADTHLYRRGSGFNIPGREIDGMDVLAVEAAAEEALKWCRDGNGPTILEMKTYRYRGHSMSDPAKYRSKDEVKQMRAEHDPIDQLRTRLLEQGAADEAGLKEIDKEVKQVVADAAEFAQKSPEPDPAELTTNVLVAPAPAPDEGAP